MSDTQAMEYAIAENLQREDLNPVEETEAILDLLALKLETNRERVIGVQPGYLQIGTHCKQMLQKPILRFTNLPKNGIETFNFLYTKINSSRDSVSQTCPRMTFLGNVFTRENTLNPVSKQRKIKGFQTFA